MVRLPEVFFRVSWEKTSAFCQTENHFTAIVDCEQNSFRGIHKCATRFSQSPKYFKTKKVLYHF